MRICERTLEAFKDMGNSELRKMPFICMKNHETRQYGIITQFSIQEADEDFIIVDRETDDKYIFPTADALVEAGWMVD
jgi:hypothetical protein